jgi:hypothetical protein
MMLTRSVRLTVRSALAVSLLISAVGTGLAGFGQNLSAPSTPKTVEECRALSGVKEEDPACVQNSSAPSETLSKAPRIQNGTIAGRIQSPEGRSVANLRVFAMQANPAIASEKLALIAAVAQTDRAGRFTFQGLPDGTYYIAAGLLEQPTYYPGATDLTAAWTVAVSGNDIKGSLNFSLNPAAFDALTEAEEVPMAPGSIRPTGNMVTATTKLALRQTLQAEDGGLWWAARILELRRDGLVKIHYLGWDTNLDSVVTRSRLQLDDQAIAKTRKPEEWTGHRGFSGEQPMVIATINLMVFSESPGKAVLADTILNGYWFPLGITSILVGAMFAAWMIVRLIRNLREPDSKTITTLGII